MRANALLWPVNLKCHVATSTS